MGNKGGAYRILVGGLEGKSLFGRHRGRWKIILRWILSKLDD
jgi:hypothetical protein